MALDGYSGAVAACYLAHSRHSEKYFKSLVKTGMISPVPLSTVPPNGLSSSSPIADLFHTFPCLFLQVGMIGNPIKWDDNNSHLTGLLQTLNGTLEVKSVFGVVITALC